jgi:4-alpha-glucanotransferase
VRVAAIDARMGVETTTMQDTDAWGIDRGYFDIAGTWWETRADTRRALLEAMGADPDSPAPPPEARVHVVRAGQPSGLSGPGELALEDGATFSVETALPEDLPFGYHEWRPHGQEPVRLIVSPGQCHLDEGRRQWGWAVQLYALRSAASWGMGDLGDLRELARWSRAELGADMLLLNPLGAVLPFEAQEPSPYYPSSRRYRNPLYLRIEDVPGAGDVRRDFTAAAAAGRALNARREIDRPAVFRLKMRVLEQAFTRFGPSAAFDDYCRAQGAPLREFAVFCALAEHHGSGWLSWPEEHRRPNAPEVARFAVAKAPRVRFHQWLQWLLDEQLRQVGREIGVMHDLPIGVDPAGADAWAFQDVLAGGVRVGAPPDRLATQGQDWGLPPFVPHKLRAAGYDPFIQIIRASLRHAGGLRMDHVMGLFRLFWIAREQTAREGAYVRYRPDELLAVLDIESHRAGATIVGEDLGTVEDGVRETLAAHRILSYRVLWFESAPPAQYPELAMATVTTHDLSTIAGLWDGSDLEEQRRQGVFPDEQHTREIVQRVGSMAGVGPDTDRQALILAIHRLLGQAPSLFVTATLEDAAAATERPNMPGTGRGRANWSLALPRTLEQLREDPLPREIAKALARS